MDMICCSANTNSRTMIVVENLRYVCMHFGKMLFGEAFRSTFSREDKMYVVLC